MTWRLSPAPHIQVVNRDLIHTVASQNAGHIIRSDLEWLKAGRHTHVPEPASAYIEHRPRARHSGNVGERPGDDRVLPVCLAHPEPAAAVDDELGECRIFLGPRRFAHFLNLALALRA